MRLSRKDYWRVVGLIRHLEKGVTRRLMWAHALGDIFERNNPRFQKKVFIEACSAENHPSNIVDFKERLLEK